MLFKMLIIKKRLLVIKTVDYILIKRYAIHKEMLIKRKDVLIKRYVINKERSVDNKDMLTTTILINNTLDIEKKSINIDNK